jgi:hypothetical protein
MSRLNLLSNIASLVIAIAAVLTFYTALLRLTRRRCNLKDDHPEVVERMDKIFGQWEELIKENPSGWQST